MSKDGLSIKSEFAHILTDQILRLHFYLEFSVLLDYILKGDVDEAVK